MCDKWVEWLCRKENIKEKKEKKGKREKGKRVSENKNK
jgi:hypothetical protein